MHKGNRIGNRDDGDAGGWEWDGWFRIRKVDDAERKRKRGPGKSDKNIKEVRDRERSY